MRRFLRAGVIVCLLTPLPALADQATAVQAVRQQPKVIDALVDNGGNMFVSVKNEKAAWSQYAAHLCNVVKPHHARIFRIRVVDVTAVSFGAPPSAWQKLGEAKCGR